MFKLIRYFLIKRTIKNPLLAARVYQMIYHPEVSVHWDKPHSPSKYRDFDETPVQSPRNTNYRQGNVVLTERQEIENALRELQNKPKKTIADKTSIGMLEAVLANM